MRLGWDKVKFQQWRGLGMSLRQITDLGQDRGARIPMFLAEVTVWTAVVFEDEIWSG